MADFLWPPVCLGCRDEVMVASGLCPTCWSGVQFLRDPLCARCGFGLSLETALEHEVLGQKPTALLCGACVRQPPPYTKGRSVVVYGEVTAQLIVHMKHNATSPAYPLMGAWLRQGMEELFGGTAPADLLVVPVPLHWRRLMGRGFNQAAFLAELLAAAYGAQALGRDVLRKRKATVSQGVLNRQQRQANLRGAFEVTSPWAQGGALGQRTVVLLDDVWTTGATVEACAQALKKAGVQRLYVLTLARVG